VLVPPSTTDHQRPQLSPQSWGHFHLGGLVQLAVGQASAETSKFKTPGMKGATDDIIRDVVAQRDRLLLRFSLRNRTYIVVPKFVRIHPHHIFGTHWARTFNGTHN
jgi:hypothetical protein